MHKKYTAVVLGCGKIGATNEMNSGLMKPASHAAALNANPRTELVALVDTDTAALKRAGDYYKVETYTDARECLEKLKPDIVVIATPPNMHEELFKLTIQLKVPAVVCEKPLSDSAESANRMFECAKSANTIVVVNYQRRFFPLFREAKEKILSGTLGRIQQITAYYTNGLLNNGGHTVDALEFLLSSKVAWVIGMENKFNTAAPFGTNIDGLIGFDNGTIVALQSLDNDSYGAHDFQIFGTKGALVIRHYGYRFDWLVPKDAVTFVGLKELDWGHAETKEDKRDMLTATVAHIVECLDGVTASESTLEDGYRTMQVLDALIASAAADGKRISL